jgi:hypothetical protein
VVLSDLCGRSPALPARADHQTPDQEGSVLVSEGGQFLLSLDIVTFGRSQRVSYPPKRGESSNHVETCPGETA